MTFWSQALEIARVDVIVEKRQGESLRVILPFAVAGLLVFPLTVGLQRSLIEQIGMAIFWALGILFGMQVALRTSAADSPPQRDQQALMGVDPAARFAGRVMSGGILTLAFVAALFGAMVVLYGPELRNGWVLPWTVTAVLFAIGLTELGTLAGEITIGLSARTSLASLIVAPLSLPLTIGAAQTMESAARDRSTLPWILLMITTDLVLAVAGVALAKPLDEARR